MATTVANGTLQVTITEDIYLNNSPINSINQLVIKNINEIDKRIATIPTSEVPLINFGTVVGAGQFITDNIKYIRLCNLDDTNWLRVRLKRVFGNQIATLGSITAGNSYLNGTYTDITLTGGTGTGAIANIVALGSGIISLGTITGGDSYTPGTYTSVPLTGGSGSGALATVVVTSGPNAVTAVTITTRGTGYVIGNVLSASNTNLGGTGSGFSVPVSALGGGITSVTLINNGTGYTNGDSLSADSASIGGGAGFAVAVSLVETVATIADLKLEAGKFLVLGDTSLSVSITNSNFVSFTNIENISCQANSAPIDIEYFVAST